MSPHIWVPMDSTTKELAIKLFQNGQLTREDYIEAAKKRALGSKYMKVRKTQTELKKLLSIWK